MIWYPKNRRKSCKIFINTCKVTGLIFVAKESKYKISKQGQILLDAEKILENKAKEAYLDIRKNTIISTTCVECSNSFPYNKYRAPDYIIERTTPKYCSKECSHKAEKRRARAARRALELNAYHEPIDPFIVFNKHNWRCCNCNIETPPTLRGTIKDNAPELDHIIPISKGGKHMYSNVQLLCRRCNANKSNNIYVPNWEGGSLKTINRGFL